MCGFFITNNCLLSDAVKLSIKEAIKFRGPDFSSDFIHRSGWLAHHSRLSIIGLDEENNQPFVDRTGGMLVFNGEILNYKCLGFKYFSKEYFSDTRLLADLIVGGNLDLSELDGFYSFVYVDGDGELKYAVRDRFGVKPLFFSNKDGVLAFSSEPIALNKMTQHSVNHNAIEEYRCLRAPIFSGSYFDGISEIEPGNCYMNGCYFDLSKYFNGGFQNENCSKISLRSAIQEGIVTRCVSDAPVGLLVSKGVDSNLINELGQFEHRYSIGFTGDEDYEYVKDKFNTSAIVHECTEEEYRDAFHYLLNLRGEPISVPNEVLLYLIARRARKDGVKVLLSGEGADEFFGGYDRIFQWAAKSGESFVLEEFIDLYAYAIPDSDGHIYDHFKKIFDTLTFRSCFDKVRYFFIRYHLPVLFRRLDFSLMAAGVEGREPIANMHVFLAAMNYGASDLMLEELGKKPLRELVADYLGIDFAYDKKVGFPVDLTKIFPESDSSGNYKIWFEENVRVFS